jgi:hypothetical protein
MISGLRNFSLGRRCGVAALVGVLTLTGVALAYFTSTGSGTASASVGALNAPTIGTASTTAGTSTVHVTWTDSTLSNGSTPAGGYYITRIRNSDSSTANACGTSPTSLTTSTATSCDDTAVEDGTYHYRVTAVYHSWTATSGGTNNVTVVADITPPTAAISFPVDGHSYNAAGFNAGCTTAGVCGTASDASGVQSAKISIKRSSDGTYWTGSAFNGTTETFNTTTLATPGGTATNWGYGLSIPADGTYVVHVQTADTVGNAQSGTTYAATSTFTIDRTAPSVAVTKVNGTARTFPYSTNQNVTSIGGTCGTATGDAATVSWSVSNQSGTVNCTTGTWSSGTFGAAISAEGSYSAQVSQGDAAGNTGTDSKTVTIDKTAPSVAVTKVNGTVRTFPYSTNQNVTSISGTCGTATGDAATVSWSFSNQSGTVNCTTGTWSSGTFVTAISAENSYSAQVSQGDAAGNTGTDSKTVTIDKTAPSVAVTMVNGTARTFPYSTNQNVTSIGGTCGTATGDNGTVSWSFSNQSGTVNCTTGTWSSGTFGTAISAENSYSAQVSQGDAAGNTGTDSKTVTIDKTAPAVPTSVSLANGGGQGNAFVNAANKASINIDVALPSTSSASDTITLTVHDVGSAHTLTRTASATAGTGTVHFTGLDLTAFSDGTITMSATSTDQAGNASGSTSNTAAKDVVAPTATITFPTGNVSGSTNWNAGCGTTSTGDVCGTTGDSGSGVDSTKTMTSVQQNGGATSCEQATKPDHFNQACPNFIAPETLSASNWTKLFTYTVGTYLIQVQAADLAGNTATTTKTITIS